MCGVARLQSSGGVCPSRKARCSELAVGEVVGPNGVPLGLRGWTGLEDCRLDLPQVDCGLKIVDQLLLALNAAVGQLANFLGVEALPLLAGQVFVQLHDKGRVAHVDKGVPHVAVVLQVDWQVEEVVLALVARVDPPQQHLLRVLVRDIPYHHRSPGVTACQNRNHIEAELVFSWLLLST